MARMDGRGQADTRVDVFVRGVLSGALVGAVIAGSTIWERRRRRAAALAVEPVVPETGVAGGDPVRQGSPQEPPGPSSPQGSAVAG